jgi:hypothetical protein
MGIKKKGLFEGWPCRGGPCLSIYARTIVTSPDSRHDLRCSGHVGLGVWTTAWSAHW